MLPYRAPSGLFHYSSLAPPIMAENEETQTEQWKSTAHRSAASSLSGLSELEAEEDDFGRLMIQNMRAEKRVRDILSGKRITPFRKSRKYNLLTSETLSRRQPVDESFDATEEVANWIPAVDDTMAPVDEAPAEPEDDVPFGHVFARDYHPEPSSGLLDQYNWEQDQIEKESAEAQDDSWPSKLAAGTPGPPKFILPPRTPSLPSSSSVKSAKSATESLKQRILDMGAPRGPRIPRARRASKPLSSPQPAKPQSPIQEPKIQEPEIQVPEEKPEEPEEKPQEKEEVPEEGEEKVDETFATLQALSRVLNTKPPTPAVQESPKEAPKPRNLPTSALARIVADAKRRGKSARVAYGDSTIDSLEGIAFPDPDADTTAASPTETVQGLELPVPETNQRAQELGQLSTMNAKLSATRSSLKDANKGMRRLEGQAEGTTSPQNSSHACFCHSCTQKRQTTSLGSPPTWSILLLLCLVVWYIVETTLCYHFCQPAYAANMSGYGVYAEAPEVPFVTITLVSRPFLWLLRRLF